MRGFTVALSRSRVVNYSRPKGIEKATSLLRCVRNPANPFSLLPLSLSLALSVSRFEHPEKKRRIRAGERRRRERGEEEAIVERIVSWTWWVEFRWNRFLWRNQSFHGLPNIAISSTRISTMPCKHRLLGNRSDPRLSLSFKIFRGYCHEASYCSIEKG